MAWMEPFQCGCPRLGYTARTAGGYAISRSAGLPSCRLGAHAHAEDRVVFAPRGGFETAYGSRTFALDRWRAIYRPALCMRLPEDERAASGAFCLDEEEVAGIASRRNAELDAADSGRLGCAWIRSVRERVEEEYADPPTVAAIAGSVGRDTSHVAHVFKRTYGRSTGDYVREVRLWRTRELVEDGAISSPRSRSAADSRIRATSRASSSGTSR